MKRTAFCVLLGLAVLASSFAMGGREKKEAEEISPMKVAQELQEGQLSWELDTSPITIDYYVDYSWYGETWQDPAAKRITERTGVILDIMTPVADDGQKIEREV